MTDRRRRAAQLALLLVILGVAAFVRFDRLGAPSYWLDEILGDQLTTHAAQSPPWKWITGFEREHGPLYYATQLASRAAGHDEAAGRIPAALFGVAAVAIVFFASRSVLAGAAAAILLAVSPLHVYYSREARPYALLMLLTAALLAALLQRSWLSIPILVLILYTTAAAVPLLAAVAVTVYVADVGGRALADRPPRAPREAIAAAACVVAATMLYRGPAAATQAAAPIDAALGSAITRAFTVSALGDAGHPAVIAALFVFAIAGAVVLFTRDRRAAIILTGLTLLPVVFTVAALRAMEHWFAVRYLSPALIAFVMLAGAGIAAFAEWIWRRGAWPIAVVVCAAIAVDTWSAARREPFRKLDWRAIGAVLERHVRPDDTIVAAEAWSNVCIRYYLRHLPPRVRIVSVSDPGVTQMLVNASQATWLLTAGPPVTNGVREYICRFPILLASPIESFRLHYAPSAAHFVRERSSAEDLRAVIGALGQRALTIHVGRDDALFRGDGWAGGDAGEGNPGDEFRWAMGKRVTFDLLRTGRADRHVVLRIFPVAHAGLPPQVMSVSLNGAPIGTATLTPPWRDYAFDAPAALWRDGVNDLTMTFSRTTRPADLDPKSGDTRELAASFDRIMVLDRGAQPAPPVGVIAVRFASDDLFATRTAPHSRRTRFPVLQRNAVVPLLGRLGFDPEPAWQHLARGDAHLEDVAASIAYDSGCEDDETFLNRAFALLVQRNPNPGERPDLMARVHRGAKRTEVVNRILRAQDFFSAVTRGAAPDRR